MAYVVISKQVLQNSGDHIQKLSDIFDKCENNKYRPFVVGYCPVCEAQHSLMYVKQTKNDFVFSCVKCMEKAGVRF